MSISQDTFTKGSGARLNFFSGISIFTISASIIFLQIVLMRSLSITRYHHFSYFIISTALLGFGASGTFLSFFSERIGKHFRFYSSLFILMFTVSIPLCYYLAESIPIDLQYIFFSGRQVLLIIVYNSLLFIPFFLGAVVIGLALINFDKDIPLVYGVNLLGSGTGGIMAIIALFWFPASRLPAIVAVVSFFALLFWLLSSRLYFEKSHISTSAAILIAGFISSVVFILLKPSVNIDQYKMISYLERLKAQSEARHVYSAFSPRARIDMYDSGRLHRTMFAGLNTDALPPSQMAVLIDGQYAGSVFKINSEEEARILDFTPQSLPYRLIESPRVLILGDIGGVNIWLAKRFGASSITVVQGNRQLNNIMKNELSNSSGGIYNMPGVNVIDKEPYLFIEHTDEEFDIIHIASVEGMSSGISGLQSLHEDYLLTVESVAGCFGRLTDRGFITVTRGIQSPPRDNLKIFSLFASALEHEHVKYVERHLLQTRNYLAVNTLISKRPFEPELIRRVKDISGELLMDIEYHPGLSSNEIVQLNVVSGPEGEKYSYFHYGIKKILSDKRHGFFNDWVYSIVPPKDDKPYFYDFFKWNSLQRFIEVYGRQWLQRLELGYVVLVLTLLEVVASALILIIMPLFWAKTKITKERGKLPTLIYFLSLGFGFMFIEMVSIQKFTRFMGNPVYSVTVVLTAILIFAGLGSMFQRKSMNDISKRIKIAMFGIMSSLIFYLVFLDRILHLFISSGIAARFIITTALLAPVAFFMGWMFPNGLILLEMRSKNLVPWAWGVNGFASVSAAPLAVMLSMSFGFKSVVVISVILYLIGGATAGFLEKK